MAKKKRHARRAASAAIKSLRAERGKLVGEVEALLGLDGKGMVRSMSADDETAAKVREDAIDALSKRIARLENLSTRDDDESDDEESDDEERDDDDESDDHERDDDDESDDDDEKDKDGDAGARGFRPRGSRRSGTAAGSTSSRRSNPWQERVSPAVHTREHTYSYARALSNLAAFRPHVGLEGEVSRHMELEYRKSAQGILLPTGGEEDRQGQPLFGRIRGIHGRRGSTRSSQRDVDTTTGSGAVFVVPELPFIELLRNQLVCRALGAQFWSNLPPGKFSIPRQNAASTSYWVGELDSTGAPVTPSNPQMTQQVAFVDKTLACLVPVSRKFLFQSSVRAEDYIRTDMAKVIAIETDRAAINGSGTGSVPTGILQNSTIQTNSAGLALGTNGGEFSFATAVNMEKTVAIANAMRGTLNYLTNPTLAGLLKQVPKVGTTFPVFILEGIPGSNTSEGPVGVMNGLPVFSSNIVPNNLTKGTATTCCAAIFGNWDDLIIAQWGGIDALINPFSFQAQGAVQFSMFTELDVQVRHPESFAIVTDALPT